MLLTHLAEKYPDYVQWAASQDDHYKILDNSLIELGGAVDMPRLLRAASSVKADEIILPDVFLDGPATIKFVEYAIEYLRMRNMLGKYALMAVCQGKDADEFVETYKALEAMEAVDVIGIPKVCAKLHPAGRPFFEGLWMYSPKVIHLLGVWYSWEELIRFRAPERIRSVDSCLATFQAHYHLPVSAVRPDGYSIDLEDNSLNNDVILKTIGAAGYAYGRSDRT